MGWVHLHTSGALVVAGCENDGYGQHIGQQMGNALGVC